MTLCATAGNHENSSQDLNKISFIQASCVLLPNGSSPSGVSAIKQHSSKLWPPVQLSHSRAILTHGRNVLISNIWPHNNVFPMSAAGLFGRVSQLLKQKEWSNQLHRSTNDQPNTAELMRC